MLTVIYGEILTDKATEKINLFQGKFRIFRKRVYKSLFFIKHFQQMDRLQ